MQPPKPTQNEQDWKNSQEFKDLLKIGMDSRLSNQMDLQMVNSSNPLSTSLLNPLGSGSNLQLNTLLDNQSLMSAFPEFPRDTPMFMMDVDPGQSLDTALSLSSSNTGYTVQELPPDSTQETRNLIVKHRTLVQQRTRLALDDDFQRLLNPDLTKFKSQQDILDRLLPYHIFHLPNPPAREIEDKTDEFAARLLDLKKRYQKVLKTQAEKGEMDKMETLVTRLLKEEEDSMRQERLHAIRRASAPVVSINRPPQLTGMSPQTFIHEAPRIADPNFRPQFNPNMRPPQPMQMMPLYGRPPPNMPNMMFMAPPPPGQPGQPQPMPMPMQTLTPQQLYQYQSIMQSMGMNPQWMQSMAMNPQMQMMPMMVNANGVPVMPMMNGPVPMMRPGMPSTRPQAQASQPQPRPVQGISHPTKPSQTVQQSQSSQQPQSSKPSESAQTSQKQTSKSDNQSSATE